MMWRRGETAVEGSVACMPKPSYTIPLGRHPLSRAVRMHSDATSQRAAAGCGTTYNGPHPAPFQPASSLTVDDARSARRLCLNASEGCSTTSPAFDPEPVPRALMA